MAAEQKLLPHLEFPFCADLRRFATPRARDRANPGVRALAWPESLNLQARKGAGIALILLVIVLWAAFVASLAPIVGKWPVLVQAPFYLIMGIVVDYPIETID